jgi:hypothetical protein
MILISGLPPESGHRPAAPACLFRAYADFRIAARYFLITKSAQQEWLR